MNALTRIRIPLASALALLLIACQPTENDQAIQAGGFSVPVKVTVHRGDDDLVTGGLGIEGLTGPVPEPSDPAAPSASELRKMAIHSNWNGIGPLSPAAGLGGLLSELPVVPGREFHAFLALPEADHPFRALVQLPDEFNFDRPCLVVAPASGSRGVYGAIAMAAPWALPDGCAVAYTDKGAGTDIFDFSDHSGTNLVGERVAAGTEPLGFELPAIDAPDMRVGMRHAHSSDHPEADWGRHVLAAAQFGLEVLSVVLEGDYTAANTQVIAAAVSNGGNAVLRAAEADDEGLLDGVVAVMPNITPPGQPALYDYATLAALYQPCMLADLELTTALPLGNPALAANGELRCASLRRAGLLDEASPAEAAERLREAGFDEAALSQAAVNVVLDFWRSVAVTYASSYLRRGAFDMPCGFSLAAPDASAAQRQSWWGSHSGIAPGAGIEIIDTLAEGRDDPFAGLLCLRELAVGQGQKADLLRAALLSARATAFLPDIPVLVIHGRSDGLIPVAFSSRPYVELARTHGADIAYWEIDHVQHFDALLAVPGVAGSYAPILPYGWRGLDRVRDVLDGKAELGGDRHVIPQPAPFGQPLLERNLGLD